MNANEIIKNKIEELINKKVLKVNTYKAGDIIYREGETCEYLGYLLKGKINISTISDGDNEEIISVINEGCFFGHFLLFQDDNKFLGDVSSTIFSKVVFIKKPILLNVLMTDIDFLNAYLTVITKESFQVRQQVKLLSHKKALDRVIYYLKTNNKNEYIEIRSVTSLAKRLNLPRETVSRMLSKLINEEKIEKTGYVYRVKI